MSNLNEAIVESLDSASNEPQPKKCYVCRAVMEYRDSVFFYNEKKWKVRLPVCPVCNPKISSDA